MKLTPARWLLTIGLILILGFALIQLIPYGRDHSNPAVVSQIVWDSAQTENLVRGACFDCHSNEIKWPWYSNVAPMSWLVYRDVQEGRSKFNFSTLTPDQGKLWVGELVEKISQNEMPPIQYAAIHSSARFSVSEKIALVDGLMATFK